MVHIVKYTFYCVYLLSRLGEGCSHTAAILFKVEAAVKNGYTACTSSSCQWNQVFSKKVCIFVINQQC